MRPPRRPSRSTTPGFSLTELLIATTLGSLLLTAITTVIISETRLSRVQLQSQQQRNDWRRLSYFLANEVGEGCQVRTSLLTSAPAANNPRCPTPTTALLAAGQDCSTAINPDNLLFTVVVPVNTGAAPLVRRVHYYLSGTGSNMTLFRCGPPIGATGQLGTAAPPFTPVQLLSGIPLTATDSGDNNFVAVTVNTTLSNSSIRAFTVRTRSLDTDRVN